MIYIGLLVAALGGGVVASLLDSWVTRLTRFEVARHIIQAELQANVAIHHTFDELPREQWPPDASYSIEAWLAHRDGLALRAQRDPVLWQKLVALYAVIGTLRTTRGRLDQDTYANLAYAISNIDTLRLGVLERMPVYGPRSSMRRRQVTGS